MSGNSNATVNDRQQIILKTVLNAVKASNNLPIEDLEYQYACSFPAYQKTLRVANKTLIESISKYLQHYGMRSHLERLEFNEIFEYVVDANDSILEKVADLVDVVSGKKKESDIADADIIINKDTNVGQIKTQWNRPGSSGDNSRSIKSKNIPKPQLKWSHTVDNSTSPHVPTLTHKPHKLVPLQDALATGQHPYKHEIEQIDYSNFNFDKVVPQNPLKYEETPLVYVDTDVKLDEMCETLKNEPELAVDIEQHSYRSYQGFICLIQISTREADYIIDTLLLRHKLIVLNEIFTNPNIVKVFHGADHDVQWLQRDYSVYVVNMFDTYQAGKLLNFHRLSLAYLTKHYLGINRDKSFQLADWRQRPLPEAMLQYSREDSHNLLYIYDCMKNDLIDTANGEQRLVEEAFVDSSLVCLKLYVKPVYSDVDHVFLYMKSKKRFHGGQLHVLNKLHRWRDTVAREEDESTGYVLPNHMLLHVAEVLPRESGGVLACCNPVPTLVTHYLREIHKVVVEGRGKEKVTEEVWFQQQNIDPYAVISRNKRSSAVPSPTETSVTTSSTAGLDGGKSEKMSPTYKPVTLKSTSTFLKEEVVTSVRLKKTSDFFGGKKLDSTSSPAVWHLPSVIDNYVSPYQLYLYNQLLKPDTDTTSSSSVTVNSNNNHQMSVPTPDEMTIEPSKTEKKMKRLLKFWDKTVRDTSTPPIPSVSASPPNPPSNDEKKSSRGWYKETHVEPPTSLVSDDVEASEDNEEGESVSLKEQIRKDHQKKRNSGGNKRDKRQRKMREMDEHDGRLEKRRKTEDVPVSDYDYESKNFEEIFPTDKNFYNSRNKRGRGGKRGRGRRDEKYFNPKHQRNQGPSGARKHAAGGNRNKSSW